MSEPKNVSKPVQLWNNAMKAVKGENTGALVEQFTAEMTLVAEGLCEDQARLRQTMEEVRRDQEALTQRLQGEQSVLESTLQEQQRDMDRRLKEIERRLSTLEKSRPQPKKHPGVLNQVTLLAGIVCGTWLIVTILKMFG